MRNKNVFLFLGLMLFLHTARAQSPPGTAFVQQSSIEDSITAWKKDDGFQYMTHIDSILRSRSDLQADTLRMNDRGRVQIKKDSAFNKFLNIPLVKGFLMLAAISFIIFIIYKILSTAGFFRLKRKRRPSKDHEQVEITEHAEFEELIARAEKAGNLNEATRYSYLQLLRLLSDKNLIQFSSDKTNHDYVQQASAYEIYHDFKKVTRYYEYIWYGEFTVSAESWKTVKGLFTTLIQKINDRF